MEVNTLCFINSRKRLVNLSRLLRQQRLTENPPTALQAAIMTTECLYFDFGIFAPNRFWIWSRHTKGGGIVTIKRLYSVDRISGFFLIQIGRDLPLEKTIVPRDWPSFTSVWMSKEAAERNYIPGFQETGRERPGIGLVTETGSFS